MDIIGRSNTDCPMSCDINEPGQNDTKYGNALRVEYADILMYVDICGCTCTYNTRIYVYIQYTDVRIIGRCMCKCHMSMHARPT